MGSTPYFTANHKLNLALFGFMAYLDLQIHS